MSGRRPLLLCLSIVGLPAPASAGAWMLAPGHGQVIVSGTFTKSSKGFDADGTATDIPDYNKFEFGPYLEYGLTKDVTLVIQPQLRIVTIGPPVEADTRGLGYSELGARIRLWSDDRSILSAQASARLPGSSDESDPAQAGNTELELDIRGLYGRSFRLGSWPAFMDAQLGYRMREGGSAGQIRADLTLGARPVPDILLLAQSFNAFATGEDDVFASYGSEHKVQLSVVWDVNERWSLQLGGIATLAGEETLAERGIIAAAWWRF